MYFNFIVFIFFIFIIHSKDNIFIPLDASLIIRVSYPSKNSVILILTTTVKGSSTILRCIQCFLNLVGTQYCIVHIKRKIKENMKTVQRKVCADYVEGVNFDTFLLLNPVQQTRLCLLTEHSGSLQTLPEPRNLKAESSKWHECA